MRFAAAIMHRVPFHDVDIMNIVWHGHYFKYFEIARTALAQKLGLDWPHVKDLGYAMPVIGVEAKYRLPIRYDDELTLHAVIEEPLLPAMIVNYAITSKDGSVTHATGFTKQAYVRIDTMETCLAMPGEVEQRLHSAWRSL
jgi:acyl-CoA thioester hydrolase